MSESNGKKSVLVVGGGIGGLQSALELADSGVRVFLLEKSPTIGGEAAKINRLFPDEAPALCRLSAKMDAVYTHPNITLITNADLKNVKKTNGAFEVAITKNPLLVNERCNGCGDCVAVCPIKPYDSFEEGLLQRTAIDIHHSRYFPGIFNIERETPICEETCPVHIDIRKYIGLIAEGKFLEALAVIREKNPLPAICGRVCNHPCESTCNRGKFADEPIAIDALKRFVTEYERTLYKEGKLSFPKPPKKSKKIKVAIAGAGPAGLTVAHDLAWQGYDCTIFEASPVVGGMLYLGIPEYRLPRDIIETEVDYIRNLGVDIRLNTPFGPDLTIDDIFKRDYKALFFGVGAYKGLKLRVPGEDDYEGFLDCIEFLRKVNLGDKTKPGKKVIVIGGGNSAIDSARTAWRLGCDEVYIVYRRSRREMPANSWEIDEAEKEGVKIHYLAAPVRITGENGVVTGMECVKMALGKPDASGRRRPVPIEGSEFHIDADLIIPAISQEPDLAFLGENHGIAIDKWNSFDVNYRTMATSREGVYAGGDAVTGPATVIEAIAAGHQAAKSIHRYLS